MVLQVMIIYCLETDTCFMAGLWGSRSHHIVVAFFFSLFLAAWRVVLATLRRVVTVTKTNQQLSVCEVFYLKHILLKIVVVILSLCPPNAFVCSDLMFGREAVYPACCHPGLGPQAPQAAELLL